MENLKAQLPALDGPAEVGNSDTPPAEIIELAARRTYYLSRCPSNGRLRSCWLSPDKSLFCGICLRGTVSSEIGSVCPSCGSCVERMVEVLDGDKAYRPAARDTKRPVATERIGKVVILKTSA